MIVDWQLIAALGIVAFAAAYVARLGWKAVRGKSAGCGSGCGSCSTAKPRDETPGSLVMLGENDKLPPRL